MQCYHCNPVPAPTALPEAPPAVSLSAEVPIPTDTGTESWPQGGQGAPTPLAGPAKPATELEQLNYFWRLLNLPVAPLFLDEPCGKPIREELIRKRLCSVGQEKQAELHFAHVALTELQGGEDYRLSF